LISITGSPLLTYFGYLTLFSFYLFTASFFQFYILSSSTAKGSYLKLDITPMPHERLLKICPKHRKKSTIFIFFSGAGRKSCGFKK